MQRSLNAAKDIMYYRLTAHLSNKPIDNKLQDTWLVTADVGLYNLSESIHFLPRIDDVDSKYITFERNKEQKNSHYWQYCDDIFSTSVDVRRLQNVAGEKQEWSEIDYNSLLNCIAVAEEELRNTFNNNS